MKPSNLGNDTIKGLWRGLVPFRIEIFTWTVLLGRVNTRSKLARIGIIPRSENKCALCNNSAEEIDHLFLHCPFSSQLWSKWMNIWNLVWVLPVRIRDAFDQWQSPLKNKFFKKVWAATFFVIVWSIWKERNSPIFNNMECSVSQIHDMVLLRLGWWISGWTDSFPYSPSEIQRNPSCLI